MSSIADVVRPSGSTLQGGAIFIGPTQPASATDGDLWFDTTTTTWWSLQAGAWVIVGERLPVPVKEGDIIYADANLKWQVGDFEAGRW